VRLPTCGVGKTVAVSSTDSRRRLHQLFVGGVLQTVTAATQSTRQCWLEVIHVQRQLVTTSTQQPLTACLERIKTPCYRKDDRAMRRQK